MIEIVASTGLAVDEKLEIKRNRLRPAAVTGKEKRLCIVTGTHGDELEGQYVCYEVIRRIGEHPEGLKGIVDVYPALNPLGIDCMARGVPMFDLDLNCIFPGTEHNHMAEWVANQIIEDIEGADLCIDLHASNVYLREIPQVRVSEQSAEWLLPYARQLNVDYIWVHEAATVQEATLAYSLNVRKTPTLVVEMGVGLRITESYGKQLADGIFYLMHQLGMWDGPHPQKVKEPLVSVDGSVSLVNADVSGIFLPAVEHWEHVGAGEHIGDIIEPASGKILQRITSPAEGRLFTLREHPIVLQGSLIARVLGGVKKHG